MEGSIDFSLLTQGLSSRDATLMVTHVLSYAHWKCVRMFTSATEKAAIDLRLDKDRAICDIYVG